MLFNMSGVFKHVCCVILIIKLKEIYSDYEGKEPQS